jgi:uncharacterized protein YecA (UPF0149 family)
VRNGNITKAMDEYEIQFFKRVLESKIKIGRNEKCPCGSGKKYKKCCIGKMI